MTRGSMKFYKMNVDNILTGEIGAKFNDLTKD